MSRVTKEAWQSFCDRARRLNVGWAAMSLLMNATSASVSTRPRYFSLVLMACKGSRPACGTQGDFPNFFQLCGRTGRQSGGICVLAGSPAESKTCSWCAASAWDASLWWHGHH